MPKYMYTHVPPTGRMIQRLVECEDLIIHIANESGVSVEDICDADGVTSHFNFEADGHTLFALHSQVDGNVESWIRIPEGVELLSWPETKAA